MNKKFFHFKKLYFIEKKEKIKENMNYIEKNYIKYTRKLCTSNSTNSIVIPSTQNGIGYLYYLYNNINISCKGDAVLRYIPYVEHKQNLKGIPYFKYVALKDCSLNLNYEIYHRMMITIFKEIGDKILFYLLESIKHQTPFDAKFDNNVSKLLEFSDYTGMDFKGLIYKWEEIFDRAPYKITEKRLSF
ncbi:hypothetical protein COBT_000134, partial [Conglomerata obtusa]